MDVAADADVRAARRRAVLHARDDKLAGLLGEAAEGGAGRRRAAGGALEGVEDGEGAGAGERKGEALADANVGLRLQRRHAGWIVHRHLHAQRHLALARGNGARAATAVAHAPDANGGVAELEQAGRDAQVVGRRLDFGNVENLRSGRAAVLDLDLEVKGRNAAELDRDPVLLALVVRAVVVRLAGRGELSGG